MRLLARRNTGLAKDSERVQVSIDVKMPLQELDKLPIRKFPWLALQLEYVFQVTMNQLVRTTPHICRTPSFSLSVYLKNRTENIKLLVRPFDRILPLRVEAELDVLVEDYVFGRKEVNGKVTSQSVLDISRLQGWKRKEVQAGIDEPVDWDDRRFKFQRRRASVGALDLRSRDEKSLGKHWEAENPPQWLPAAKDKGKGKQGDQVQSGSYKTPAKRDKKKVNNRRMAKGGEKTPGRKGQVTVRRKTPEEESEDDDMLVDEQV